MAFLNDMTDYARSLERKYMINIKITHKCLLAVTNDRIQPPNKVQNKRNKQSFDTYTFTINIVPLVLEKTCFAGHTFKYKWKTRQKVQSGKS